MQHLKTFKNREPIAIVGIGCRFPGGANNSEAFWNLLINGVDAIAEVPANRWNISNFYHPDTAKPGKIRTRWGGFIEDIDQFDAQFFGISPREAACIDPQQRLLLEVVWEALEDGGQVAAKLANSQTGVFIGISGSDYHHIQLNVSDRHLINAYTHLGGVHCIAANRISYVLNLQGPSLAVDTACSSSLVAVHLACQSIWNGESSAAIAGGVNAMLKPETSIGFSKASMLSPDGRCFTFDARANGYVRGEGVGVVFLKPLSQAQADKDPIYAVIKATAVNQDGQTNGITVPNGKAQEAAILSACEQAGILPEQVQYVEAHGTGTPVGDPIETKALGHVLGKNRPAGEHCLIGSVKTNIGHLEPASGIAGLIKVALAIKNGQIPPNLNLQTPNPEIPFTELRLRVPTNPEPWPDEEKPRIAGINSFGFGGTNAHTILAEVPQPPASLRLCSVTTAKKSYLLPLSARSEAALKDLAAAYKIFLTNTSLSLSDICYTATFHRDHHDHRLAVVGSSPAELADNLAGFLAEETRLGMSEGRVIVDKLPKLAFVFSGMGQQWWAMGRSLLEETVFREKIQQCDHLLQQYTDWSLWEELTASEESSRINETQIAQCAIFSVQVALAALWESWGIVPAGIVGHSVGEVAAAYVAGVLSLEDAVCVIFHRSRLQATTAGQGKMLAVGLSLEEAEKVISGYEDKVSIGAVNSYNSVTLSGDSQALGEIAQTLEQQEVFCRFLKVEVPYHSPLMEHLKADLLQTLSGISPKAAAIPLFSTVTGQQVVGTEIDGAYWGENMRNPVLFAAAVEAMMEAEYNLFLEIGAHPVLANYISECFTQANQAVTVLPSLRRQESDLVMMLGSFGKLYTVGYAVDWNRLDLDGRFVRVPSYPWQKEQYWHESEESQQARMGEGLRRSLLGKQVHPLLGSRLECVQLLWNATIDQSNLTYLKDHCIQGSVVYPGAGYIEMALATAKEIFGAGSCILEDVEFLQALFLADEPVTLQLSVEDQNQNSFNIHSLVKGEKPAWVRHAIGNLLKLQNYLPEPIILDEIRTNCHQEISQHLLYQQFQEIGLEYGANFQGIAKLWTGEKQALAQIQLPENLTAELPNYQLHPAILDACFQVLIGTVSTKQTYLPIKIEKFRFYKSPGLQVWTYARLVTENTKQITGDIQIIDADGNILVEIQGFCCRSLPQAQEFITKEENLLYQYQWELKSRPDQKLIINADYLPSPHQINENLHSEAMRLSQQLGRKIYYEQVNSQVDALSVSYIIHAFQQLGWKPELHQQINTDTFIEQLGIASQHRRLFGRLLEILAQENILKSTSDKQWQVNQIPEVEKPQEIWRNLFTQFPAYQAELTLQRRCGEKLAQVLRGEIDPLQLIFPEGSLTASEQLYQDSPNYRIYNLLVQKAVALALERLPAGRKIRILEIGAGTGALTSYILPKLPAKRTEYVFTDVTQVFVNSAQQKFSSYDFIDYAVLDIESEPISQGFDTHSFDLIVASDVLHATTNLPSTLENIKQLLASQGLLIFIELTNAPYWVDLVFGMLPGWWLFADERKINPLLSALQWQDLLIKCGFTEVDSLADSDGTFASVHQVFLAQTPQIQPEILPEFIPPASSHKSETWLIFGDKSGVGQKLGERLKQHSQTPIFILPGNEFQQIADDCFQIRPAHLEDIQRILNNNIAGIIHLWSLDIPAVAETTLTELEQAQKLGCLTILYLVQTLEKIGISPRLVLVTDGIQAIGKVKSLEVGQSPLWGLGRVIDNEFPNLRCLRIDISSKKDIQEINALFAELWSEDREDEIVLRGEARYVHRLVSVEAGEINSKPVSENQPFRLEITQPGILDHLTLRRLERKQPEAGEVEIEVYATGLNFKDVAKAMNLLADVNLEGNFSGRSLGLECAGKITAIGAGVTNFQIGDEVIASAPHSFSSHTITDARLVVHKPQNISFEEAATIPAVFLTAYYALHYLGRITKGEKVLIHAAAGGVGLAAIQLAQKAGAEIFATAGSPEKRELLQALGVKYVMDSRTLDFADQIMQYTNGKGVDIVLNSLAGAAIPKSLSVLAPYGRFIEIGKRDIDDNNKLGLRPFQKNLSFFAVDLDRLWKERAELAGSLFAEVMQLFREQTLHPLPHRVFPISQVKSAFRYMAQAKHIGKIVISLQNPDVIIPPPQEKITFDQHGTYLITGGLGGFSLALAQWLVEHGAGNLVLMGRSGQVSPDAELIINSLKAAGTNVVVAKADVSQADQVARVLKDIKESLPPLRGIFHAALVLDDAILLQLNQERFQKVIAPKVDGAWNLHTQTLNIPLDCFVLFSSVAATIGNPGQGNYVAASVFLDTLAHYRRNLGLKALSVNWGVIADVGYAAQKSHIGEHFQRLGLKPLQSQQALQVLEKLLQADAVQTAVAPVDWQQWHQAYPAGISPRFSYLTSKESLTQEANNLNLETDSFRNILLAATDREQLLSSRLVEQVARVLGTSAAKLDTSKSLTNLGLDSLMAVELSNRIKNELEAKVPAMKIMQGLNISQLTAEIMEQLTGAAKQNVSVKTGDWLVFPRPNSEARLRLFCLPYINGSSSVFSQWPEKLPPDIEVCAVQLPGGSDRLNEPPIQTLTSLIETLTDVLIPHLNKPFAFYGHSLGALISFELARYLRQKTGKIPVHLFVAALQAPQLPHPYPSISHLSDSQALKKASLLDLPEAFGQNPELMQLLLPGLKAGIAISQNYTYAPDKPLECPITAFGGNQDKVITQEHLLAWEKQTSSTFNLQIFPGNHLFLHTDQNLLLPYLATYLN